MTLSVMLEAVSDAARLALAPASRAMSDAFENASPACVASTGSLAALCCGGIALRRKIDRPCFGLLLTPTGLTTLCSVASFDIEAHAKRLEKRARFPIPGRGRKKPAALFFLVLWIRIRNSRTNFWIEITGSPLEVNLGGSPFRVMPQRRGGCLHPLRRASAFSASSYRQHKLNADSFAAFPKRAT